jgi:glycogen(starch) synthase
LLGNEVCVLTRGSQADPVEETLGSVRVVRAASDALAIDFTTESLLAWTQAFEHSLIRVGLSLLAGWQPDVIHAHDWLVAQTARTLNQVSAAPLVVTMHATEYGRQQQWLAEPLHRAIHSVERWLCRRADAVITCSSFMADEVATLYDIERDQLRIIANAIDLRAWSPAVDEIRRAEHRYGGCTPLIAFAGRFVHEKGVQELVKALPLLRSEFPGLRLVLAGAGPQLADQLDRARRYGVDDIIYWPGFLDDVELAALFSSANVVVVPSLYEPFGLIALEAQAVGTPVVVADTGGLRDLVEPGVTGLRFAPEDPAAIADAVRLTLANPEKAAEMAIRAQRRAVLDFGWDSVARSVVAVYASVQNSSPRAR